MDEADKLLKKENLIITVKILDKLLHESSLPPQLLAFSATFTEKDLTKLRKYFSNNTKEIFLLSKVQQNYLENPLKRKNPNDIQTILLESNEECSEKNHQKTENFDLNLASISQFYIKISANDKIYKKKTETLIFLLSELDFSQCFVFYNEKFRGEELAEDLKSEGFNVCFIHGEQTQSDRIKVMNRLALNKVNIIITTDLLSRGIDILGVDLVINYDLPHNLETYFHRIGRCGRYGSLGASISLVTEEDMQFVNKNRQSLNKLNEVQRENTKEIVGEKLKKREIHKSLIKNQGFCFDRVLEWKNIEEKLLDEDAFKYFIDENEENKRNIKNTQDIHEEKVIPNEIKNLECLNCNICKEMFQKSFKIFGGSSEILKYFKV